MWMLQRELARNTRPECGVGHDQHPGWGRDAAFVEDRQHGKQAKRRAEQTETEHALRHVLRGIVVRVHG